MLIKSNLMLAFEILFKYETDETHKTSQLIFIEPARFVLFFCGKWGIRTPGTLQFNGFQDRRDRPLRQLSEGKSNILFLFCQILYGVFTKKQLLTTNYSPIER